jgi:DNA adenine methylase
MTKSPLRYPGGKSRGISFLSQFIPSFNELREVFFGGGSWSFYCAQTFPEKKIIASDLNYELCCFWQQLKTNPKLLIAQVSAVYKQWKPDGNGKDLFMEIVARRNKNLSELQRAVDFFVLNRITFSGVVDSGGYSKGSFEGRFTQTAIDRLEKAAWTIRHIEFFCEDFSFLIDKKGKGVFLFLDPPYYSATKSKLYGKNGLLHIQFEHEKLFEHLKKTPHKWLLTYDNTPFIKELYKGFYQLPWSLQYGMTNESSEENNELLISNYNIIEMKQNKSNYSLF